jgi:hypothetical protein
MAVPLGMAEFWTHHVRMGIAARTASVVVALSSAKLVSPEDALAIGQTMAVNSLINSPDLLLSAQYGMKLLPLCATLCLIMIGTAELSHIGLRLKAAYIQPGVFAMLYRLRPVCGIMAVMFSIAPSLIFHGWIGLRA